MKLGFVGTMITGAMVMVACADPTPSPTPTPTPTPSPAPAPGCENAGSSSTQSVMGDATGRALADACMAHTPSSVEIEKAAALWSLLIRANTDRSLDASRADALDASSSVLAPLSRSYPSTTCGGGGVQSKSSALISDPFKCTDDCRPTFEDLVGTLGKRQLDMLVRLASDPEVRAALDAKDKNNAGVLLDAVFNALALPGVVDAAVKELGPRAPATSVSVSTIGAIVELLPYVADLQKLIAKSNSCKQWRAANCGGVVVPPVGSGPPLASITEVSGMYRVQWQSHVPNDGKYTQTSTVQEIKIDFTLAVTERSDDGAVFTLQGPGKLDIVKDQGVTQNIVVPSGEDCPASWHITGQHVFDVTVKGRYEATTGKIAILPATFQFTSSIMSTDCMRGPHTSDPFQRDFAFEGCEGTLVNGAYDDEHTGRHKPNNPYNQNVVVDKDVDECHIVAR